MKKLNLNLYDTINSIWDRAFIDGGEPTFDVYGSRLERMIFECGLEQLGLPFSSDEYIDGDETFNRYHIHVGYISDELAREFFDAFYE